MTTALIAAGILLILGILVGVLTHPAHGRRGGRHKRTRDR